MEQLYTSFSEKLDQLMLSQELMDDLPRIYIPLANIINVGFGSRMQVIGVNGAQGAGKSTFCQLLKLVLEEKFGKKVASWSIDDLYLSRKERKRLSEEVHPLLMTRGVPGTHDVKLGLEIINSLRNADKNTVTMIPRFNKAVDDVYPKSEWTKFVGKPDVVLIDGWCIDATAQEDSELITPVNELEATEDKDCVWRRYVNDQLKTTYKDLFDTINFLVMLQIPSYDKVFEWRNLQEEKLRIKNQGKEATHIMTPDQVRRFIAHYERITRHILAEMPERADMLFKVNDNHRLYI
jgi:D-glycerate 3-kinase